MSAIISQPDIPQTPQRHDYVTYNLQRKTSMISLSIYDSSEDASVPKLPGGACLKRRTPTNT